MKYLPKIIVIRPNCPFGSGIWSIQDLFTVNFPRLHPHRYVMAVDSFLLGRKGDLPVLHFSSRTSVDFISRPLPWDLWAFHCIYSW